MVPNWSDGVDRYAFLIAGSLNVVFLGGQILGWSGVQLILENDSIYSGLCCGGSLECDARSIAVSTAFTTATVSLMVSSMPHGMVHDSLGPRVLNVGSNILIAIGALMISLFRDDDSATESTADLFILGFAVLSFGGGGLQMSYATTANMFPGNEGLIIGILSGCMGGSALTPILLAAVNRGISGASLQALYAAMAVLALCFAAFGMLLPGEPFPQGGRACDGLPAAPGSSLDATARDKQAGSRKDGPTPSGLSVLETDRAAGSESKTEAIDPANVARGQSQVVLLPTEPAEPQGTRLGGDAEEGTSSTRSRLETAADDGTGQEAKRGSARPIDVPSNEVSAAAPAARDTPEAQAADSRREAPGTGASCVEGASAVTLEYLGLASEPRALFLLLFFVVTYFRLVFYLGTAQLQLGDMLGIRSVDVDGETATVAADASGGCDAVTDSSSAVGAGQEQSPAQQEQARIEGEVENWLELLGWIAPVGAFMAAVAGMAYDRFGALWAMGLVVALGIVHSAFVLVPIAEAQPVTFLTYTLQQEAIFAIILARVMAVYGPGRFGVLAGLLFLIGALCAVFVTPVTSVVLKQNNGEFFAANTGLLVLTVLSTGYLYRLWLEDAQAQDDKADEEGNGSVSGEQTDKASEGGGKMREQREAASV